MTCCCHVVDPAECRCPDVHPLAHTHVEVSVGGYLDRNGDAVTTGHDAISVMDGIHEVEISDDERRVLARIFERIVAARVERDLSQRAA